MFVKLLTEHHLEFLSLKGGCRGLSESTLVKMSNCWKSHALAQFIIIWWTMCKLGMDVWLVWQVKPLCLSFYYDCLDAANNCFLYPCKTISESVSTFALLQHQRKFCLFDLILYVSVNNFSEGGRVFLGWTFAQLQHQHLFCLFDLIF